MAGTPQAERGGGPGGGEAVTGAGGGPAGGPRIGERSIGLFVAAVFLLSPIGLAIFSVPQLAFGFPVLALYLFGVWAVIIALLAGLARLGEASEAAAEAGPPTAGEPSGGEA
ncbi:MAG: hypothetical protein GVY13_05140 [Alphaproteobacteria bacterium]|jgi:hypothetical protein|nr:hypothetical protein [Alphaproteobacteria bacterium]